MSVTAFLSDRCPLLHVGPSLADMTIVESYLPNATVLRAALRMGRAGDR